MQELYILIIIKLIATIFLGGICAFFSHLLDYCFWDGSIFSGYLPWLSRTLVVTFKPSDYAEVQMLKKELRTNEYMHRAESIFLYKVLGGCVVCTNVWLANLSFIGIQFLLGIGWWYMIAYVASSSFILRRVMASK